VFDSAQIHVNGNVTIAGGLQGLGSIYATGNITISGPVNFTSAGGFALALANGDVNVKP